MRARMILVRDSRAAARMLAFPKAPQEDRNELAPLTHEEEHILRCLGAAVIMQWNDLPTKIQRELFEHASSMGELNHTAELKGQVARFLHQHKDDGRESA